jgi:hypothetical protein
MRPLNYPTPFYGLHPEKETILMSKIQEIIKSGQAPGVRTGAVNPNSVFAKVPRALKEIERGETRSKRGMDARDISKAFGMSTSFIKSVWSKSNPRAFSCIAILLLCLSVNASDMNPGTTFQDGQTVHAADLNGLVGNATINPTFVSGKPIQANPTVADYFLFYLPASGILERETLGSIFNSTLPFSQDIYAVYTTIPANTSNQVFFLIYDPTNTPSGGVNGTMAQISLPNLFMNSGSPIVQYLGTNGIIPYVFGEVFTPSTFYTTNTAYPSGSNTIWGWTTVQAITNLFYTNSFLTSNSIYPTLLDSDTVPFESGRQYTNSTFTLNAWFQYFTNKWTFTPQTLVPADISMMPGTLLSGGYPNNLTTNAPVAGTNILLGTGLNIALQTNVYYVTNGGVFTFTNIMLALQRQQFVSTLYSLPGSGGVVANVAHGFTNTPSSVQWVLVNQTGEWGYLPGDEISVQNVLRSNGNKNPVFGSGANTTNVFLSLYYSAGDGYDIVSKTNSSSQALTAGNWEAKCYARP